MWIYIQNQPYAYVRFTGYETICLVIKVLIAVDVGKCFFRCGGKVKPVGVFVNGYSPLSICHIIHDNVISGVVQMESGIQSREIHLTR